MLNVELLDMLKHSLANGEAAALITIVNSPELGLLGARFLLWDTGKLYPHTTVSPTLKKALTDACLPLLQQLKSKTITLSWGNQELECFVEVYTPSPRLIIAGAGHVGEAVAHVGQMLGFQVTVVDDRKSFANRERFPAVHQLICQSFLDFFRQVPLNNNTYILLLTRGHRFDVICLRELLARPEKPAYIGMIGSRRRITGVFEQVKQDFPAQSFEHIFAPVGLDIGAETPEEIAVSIYAEILKVKHKRSGQSLTEHVRKYTLLGFK